MHLDRRPSSQIEQRYVQVDQSSAHPFFVCWVDCATHAIQGAKTSYTENLDEQRAILDEMISLS